jgi:hypothetical protein
MRFAEMGCPSSFQVKPFMVLFWAVSATMRSETSCGFVMGPSAALSSTRSSWRTVSSFSSLRCARSSRASVMSAGLPLNAAKALPAHSAPASCTGDTSVEAIHTACWAT